MALILRVSPDPEHTGRWLSALRRELPRIECRPWDRPGDLDEVEYAVVWRPPPGELKRFASLKAVFSIGAGVDHILCDPELPRGVPVFRTTGPQLVQRMREYVALHTLRHHRRMPELQAQQARAEWRALQTPSAERRRVGIMGMGTLGGAAARTLAGLGFDVAGWGRSPRPADAVRPVTYFHGPGQRQSFLARSEILICLLPLTDETENCLDRGLFDCLPRGACLIHAGRGAHLVEQDLLQALEDGRLGGATLDVFRQEPLPPKHPFWTHPLITVTPHLASLIDPDSGAHLLADAIRRFRDEDPLDELRVDPSRGY